MALLHVNFFSEALGMCVACDVILPQRATKQIGMAAAARGDKHPTLWLLHGASDNHTIWQRRTSIERYAAPLGLAVVMPNAHLSSYADMAHGGKYYTYISQELPEKMRAMFPLSDKREDNFIAGLSMGGAGCMKIGLNNPQNYAAIGCLSAGAINRDGIAMTPERRARMIMTYGTEDISIFTRKGTPEDVFGAAQRILDEEVQLNLHDVMNEAYLQTRAGMTTAERRQFGRRTDRNIAAQCAIRRPNRGRQQADDHYKGHQQR